MNIPYRTRRVLNRIGAVLMVLLILLAITWLCWVIWLERYIVYTRDGAELDLTLSSHDLVGEVASPPVGSTDISIYYNDGSAAVETSNELKQLDGYFIDMEDLTKNVQTVWDNLDLLPAGTPVMIELKGGYGSFYYRSNIPGAIASKSVSADSVEELLREMKERGFYMIAKISSFRDYEYGLNHVPSGLYTLSKIGLWADDGGCYWLNPTDTAVLTYISTIVTELRDKGFHEVVLGDFRFPASEKYLFNGDKTAALVSAAETIQKNCATESFAVSFSVSDPTLTLPTGRGRMYLENVDASRVESNASRATVENTSVRLVFVAETNDTRFNDYSVLRPITSADVLEAQKAARAAVEAAVEDTQPPEA